MYKFHFELLFTLQLHLDRTKIIPELVDSLIGASVGAHRRADVDFPAKLIGPGASMAGEGRLCYVC